MSAPLRRDSAPAYYIAALAVGGLAGLIGVGFHLAVDTLLTLRAGWQAALGWVGWQLLASAAVSVAMIAIALVLVRRLAPETSGSGVQEIEGALQGIRPLRWRRVLPVKFVGGVLALGAGLVQGREGPTIHMGASFGAAVAEFRRLPSEERRGLIAAGAAAGLAAAFNAPLAAILFVIEETRRQFPYTFRTYSGVILAACLGGFMTEAMTTIGPNLAVAAPAASLWQYPLFVALGAVLGVAGVGFNALLLAMLEWTRRLGQRHPWLFPLSVAAAAGMLLVLLPEATGGGETLIVPLITSGQGLGFLLLLLLVRILGTFLSYPAGVPGGIFSPMLTLATCTGLIFGGLLDMVAPDSTPASVTFAVAAMGALFTATVRAPLVGVALTMELTGAYDLLLPTVIACATANLVAQGLGGRPIYELLLERTLRLAGQPIPEPEERLPVEPGWKER